MRSSDINDIKQEIDKINKEKIPIKESTANIGATPQENPKKHWRIRRNPNWRQKEPKTAEPPVAIKLPSKQELPPEKPDVVEEQKENPMITTHCPESISEDMLPQVKKNPEDYVEINMIKKTRVVDAYYIPAEKKVFHYKKKEYHVKEDSIYLLPTKTGMFMPTCYYHEDKNEPTGFKQTNKGITGKALSLLYMEQLYTSLLYSEDLKYNFFIVILSIASLIAFGIGCYFVFFHGGGLFAPAPPPVLPPGPVIGG